MSHVVQVALANYLAFVLRFEAIISPEYLNQLILYLPVLLVIRLVFYFQAGLYKDLWRYSSISDLIKILQSVTFGSVVFFVVVRHVFGDTSYPRAVFVLDWILLLIISGGTRLFVRIFSEYVNSQASDKRTLIIGAGTAGELIVRNMKYGNDSSYEPVGFIDDDPFKKGLTIHGVPIFGPRNMIPQVMKKYKPDEIVISIPSADNETIKEIYELCKPFNVPVMKLPKLNDMLNGNSSVVTKLGQRLVEADLVTENQIQEALKLQKKEGGRLGSKLVKLGFINDDNLVSFLIKHFGISYMKPISLEDLLQRDPVRNNIESVKDFIHGKTVMVTGAGGSIGSELCRQIMQYDPANLIMYERYENNLFKIDSELRNMNGRISGNIVSVVGDILDKSRLKSVFSHYGPEIVFHAAAHKHVPLMEANPIEAVKNNIFGTKNLVDISTEHNTENMVLISTDKAVNPTSIMGATKRIAEFLTMRRNASSATNYTTVRFGNVLGSNGSVIPTFKEQLKLGGPLRVTHPDIKRYFMVISEAIQLVLLAAASGNSGGIFVLNMGEQIKIKDLAENLIRLSGFVPHKEIRIEYTGLRPGEKLYEEIFDKSEKIFPAFSERFNMAVPIIPSEEALNACVSELESIVQENAVNEIIPVLQKIVPSFIHKHTLISDQYWM